MGKKSWVTIAVIILVILLALIVINRSHPETDSEVAKCIGENAILYTQLGCHGCKIQEEMFGDNYKYLNVIDCWFEGDKCLGIEYTPTWIIKGEKYIGVQSIEKLQQLTGCE